ncbi:hypothetical protein DCS_00881 [Drechmeria coniospora]|uniref:SMP-LTD domain-containing protein n=1 Tax=Drechmeria coniospora TaxID=98403 RepID=A0A151GRK2_DRECN|nr:hypothetical protein DCS_00881 [Drechmeria coniospora]KYK59747.1 hypothetical protein DCS_00881 [Drechmeria coniospora]
MASWTALLAAYLVGGVTFIPLVIAVVFVHGYYTFPFRGDVGVPATGDQGDDDIVQAGDDMAPLEEAKKAASEEPKMRTNHDFDVAAGYFAVCREYTPMGINAKPIERSTPLGLTTITSPSPSVYQTMYRSIFDRKPVPGPLGDNSSSIRPKKAGNVFYVVLRHGHLMLFDDDEQLEVRHVISLAHHDISIYSGGDVTPEGELFIKRNALCLSRRRDQSDPLPDSPISKPFYLFSENCSAKEDFYFALLKNQEQTFELDGGPTKPKQFDVKSIISLVQRLHSSDDHRNTRWLNAFLGRIFLSVHKTSDLENFIREKVTKKISRVKRPSFLTNITIEKIHTGEAAPFFTNFRLKDLSVEGECVVEADVRYSGNSRIEVAATAKIDLGARFKAREVNLVLAVVLKRVEGHVMFKVKAPPSNRVWFSFQSMPKMEMAIEPIVSSRQITYTVILRQIENRIKEVFAETLVQPFWDDVPFFKTEHKRWRGGIFEGDDAVEPSESDDTPADGPADVILADRPESRADLSTDARSSEKSHSEPLVDLSPEKTGLFGRKAGANATDSSTSVASTGVEAKAASAVPSRSPSIVKTSTGPVVGTETAHADLFRPSSSPPDHATNFMAALQSRSQDASPMVTPVGSPSKASSLTKALSQSSTLTVQSAEEDKEKADHAPIPPGRRSNASSTESEPHSDIPREPSPASSTASSLKHHAGTLGRSLFSRREGAINAASTESSNGDLKRNTIAAVTQAAAQAKQWGWNALQRQKDARRNDGKAQVDLSQPMGRGQPLPPPGMPLPGPANNGRPKIGTVIAPKHRPAPDPMPAEGLEQHMVTGVSPAIPPPVPPRNRRVGTELDEADGGENMLVVAAPDDSQPGTPTTQGSVNDETAWTDTIAAAQEAKQKSAEIDPTSVEMRSVGKCDPFLSDSRLPQGSPIIALPAASAVIDDDDDYSGWMDDDDNFGEDGMAIHDPAHHQPPASQGAE